MSETKNPENTKEQSAMTALLQLAILDPHTLEITGHVLEQEDAAYILSENPAAITSLPDRLQTKENALISLPHYKSSLKNMPDEVLEDETIKMIYLKHHLNTPTNRLQNRIDKKMREFFNKNKTDTTFQEKCIAYNIPFNFEDLLEEDLTQTKSDAGSTLRRMLKVIDPRLDHIPILHFFDEED